MYCFIFILQILLDWINDELAHLRIIVKDLEEDLFDGQIIQKLFGQYMSMLLAKYFGCKLMWVSRNLVIKYVLNIVYVFNYF